MKEELKQRLLQLLLEDHLDIVIPLIENGKLDKHINERMASVETLYESLLEEVRMRRMQPTGMRSRCWQALVTDLSASKYHYVRNIMERHSKKYSEIKESGMSTSTIISIINNCNQIFDEYDFNAEKEDDLALRDAVLKMIETMGLI